MTFDICLIMLTFAILIVNSCNCNFKTVGLSQMCLDKNGSEFIGGGVFV